LSKRRDVFAAIADPTRRRVLDLLRERPTLPAGEIATHFPSSARPGVSRHLRVLRESGLVRAERHGRELRYRLDPAPLAALRDGWLAPFSGLYIESLRTLRHHIENDDPASDPAK
jgi:DNA-binding transcriptional ArsR family regulator